MNNVADMLVLTRRKHGNRGAFAVRHSGAYRVFTYDQVFQEASEIAAGLISMGIEKGDRIGLFADNRYEWMQVSLGITFAGAADVPRGTDVTVDELSYIVDHSRMRMAVVENRATLEKLNRSSINADQLLATISIEETDERCISMEQLKIRGRDYLDKNPSCIKDRIATIGLKDLYTLIYTSGTTGLPKGVMLSHGNLISQVQRIPFTIKPSERALSILPVWHIFERNFELLTIFCGACTYYSSIRTLKEDLKLVRPSFMASAPRLWESIYAGILMNVAKAPAVRRGLFKVAVSLAGAFRGSGRAIRRNNLRLKPDTGKYLLTLPYQILKWTVTAVPAVLMDFIVLRKIRAATGGSLRGSVSGGGALPIHVDKFFNDIGIPVLEGYGLTETSPVLAVRTFDHLVPGTVGPIYKDTEIRIVDLNTGEIQWSNEPGRNRSTNHLAVKGEIHVRGPQVTSGYYRNEEATVKVLSPDGWFNTGDLGMMTANGCLKIVGRSKETIVLLGGENVEPGPIENRLLQSRLIQHCMVVGQDKKYLGALVIPEPAAFDAAPEDLEKLSKDPEVRAAIQKEIKELVNEASGFKSFERVVDIRLLPKAFEQGDELTAKLSVKRHVVTDRYEGLIEDMYSDRKPAGARPAKVASTR
ncbi:MAG: long-chain fatty acid--CoA ligase [Spirochaetaceae bacterium]|nr:long-chain fatty acid--CoA ligase [Spirochaetaceae bacterium]